MSATEEPAKHELHRIIAFPENGIMVLKSAHVFCVAKQRSWSDVASESPTARLQITMGGGVMVLCPLCHASENLGLLPVPPSAK